MNPKTKLYALWAVAAGVGLFAAAPYASLNPNASRVELHPSFPPFYALLTVHIASALVALLIGPLQGLERLRGRYPTMHRFMGRVYAVSIAVSALISLVLAFHIESFTKALAFLVLSLLWLFTCWRGVAAARSKQFQAHRLWMMRSYAITCVAVTARLLVPACLLVYAAMHGFTLTGGREYVVAQILEVNIWVGLVVNLAVAEWVIARNRTKGKDAAAD